MENNSKSGLKIKQMIGVTLTLVILGTSIPLFGFEKQELEVAKQEEQQEEQIEKVTTYTRDIQPTSRYGGERTLAQADEENKEEETEEIIEEKEQYISIDEIQIARDMDLTVRCGISKEDFKTLMQNLKSDTTGFFYENSDTIYDLCEEYQINELFFCGLIAAESGWKIAGSHRRTCNYVSMMSKGKLIQYNTPEEGLEAAAKLLHEKYLTEGGSYYYGKTLSCVQTRYCPNSSTWVNLVYGCMKYIVN